MKEKTRFTGENMRLSSPDFKRVAQTNFFHCLRISFMCLMYFDNSIHHLIPLLLIPLLFPPNFVCSVFEPEST